MMSQAILLVLSLVSVSAFVPLSKVASKSLLSMSFAGGLPGNEGPEIKNFDPLKLSEKSPEWVPFFREAELKHGRIAMLATVGVIAPSFARLPGSIYEGSIVEAHNIAVKSGSLGQVLLWVSVLEFISIPAVQDLFTGKRQPGDFAFDPLGFSKTEAAKKKYQVNELKNGRLAMLAFSGMITQAALTGKEFPDFSCKPFFTIVSISFLIFLHYRLLNARKLYLYGLLTDFVSKLVHFTILFGGKLILRDASTRCSVVIYSKLTF